MNRVGRKFNRKLSGFPYFKFPEYLTYKAALAGIKVIKVFDETPGTAGALTESNGSVAAAARRGHANRVPNTPHYSTISRHTIDCVCSVVRNLLKQGFDIYATDWRTPSAYDKDPTIGHFVNSYLERLQNTRC